MSDFASELPGKVPGVVRSDKSAHRLSEESTDSIYSFYTAMTVNTTILQNWWNRWCDTVNYPDTQSLLDCIYIDNNFPWYSSEFRQVIENFRESKKMLPLLKDDFVKLILPKIYVAFINRKNYSSEAARYHSSTLPKKYLP